VARIKLTSIILNFVRSHARGGVAPGKTCDDQVMAQWQAPDIFLKDQPFEKQERLFKWIKDNVDFPVREKRVN
jgi:hypothetical protein